MLLGPGERLHALADVHEPDVHGEHSPVELARLDALALLLQRTPEPVEDAEPLLVTRGGELERAPQDRFRDHVRALLEEAGAQRLRHPQLPLGRPQRLLELGDGLVEQAHLLEGDPQIVMRLKVRLVDVLLDPLAEAGQHLVKSRSSSPVGSSSATVIRVLRWGISSSRTIALRSTNSPATSASSRTFILASFAASFFSGFACGGADTGASMAIAALARSFLGSCSPTRWYTARALSGRSWRSSVSASSR